MKEGFFTMLVTKIKNLTCNFSTSMALSLDNSNTYLLLHPQLYTTGTGSSRRSSLKVSKFRISCSCDHKVQVNATSYKRKLRPSFLEQVQSKWSQKLPSTREKFPWQGQEHQYQHLLEEKEELEEDEEDEEDEEEEETKDKQACDVVGSELANDGSPSVSFSVPNHLISAPWVHGIKHENTHFESPRKKEYNVANGFFKESEVDEKEDNMAIGFPKSNDDREEIVGKKVSFDDKIEDKVVNFDDASFELDRDEERVAIKDSDGTKPSSDNVVINSDSSLIGLPWREENVEGQERRKRSNTALAEKMLPEHELKRLRNVALRMLERIKVGPGGITQNLVDAIHEKWRVDEVVKLKFEEPLSCNMKRTHEMLENRTGGMVIWRSGSSVVLYRGIAYKFQCVQSYNKKSEADMDVLPRLQELRRDAPHSSGVKDLFKVKESFIPDAPKYLGDLPQEELMDFSELNHLLDELGPRYKDWCGCEPLPVDADLLPAVIPEYKPPLRLLPYKVRRSLRDSEMTVLRRIARTMPPHFALGRNRELQGLAQAMLKLWERSAVAKIAIKRDVEYTRNERMAEELKRLTGGVLLSRNKEYIVFYRGNDFLPPAVSETLKMRQRLRYVYQEGEEYVRQIAPTFIGSNPKVTKGPFVAGTLAETMAASSRWGNPPSRDDIEEMRRDSTLGRCALLVKHLQNKLAIAKGKLKTAEKALAKVQERLDPAELPTDLETLSDEERFLFRKMGLSMKPFLVLGKRGVFDGTIENMHLHWKYRELVKIFVTRKNLAQVKHIAIALEAESGGILVSLDRTTKGYAIIVYRGKNYLRPQPMRPANLLTRRQALARSIELQRREGLKHHISDLQEQIELMKSDLEDMKAGKKVDLDKTLHLTFDNSSTPDDDEEDEGEEENVGAYDSSDEDMHDRNEKRKHATR